MSDEEPKGTKPDLGDPSDAEIEREIRSGRRFSLAEAIGRNAGDLMKGASPVTRKQQAEFEIKELLERHLVDAEGSLTIVLLRQVKASRALLENYDDALASLTQVLEGILDSDESLQRFVIKVDAEWGRLYLEPPHFESDELPPDYDDPYTRESVRSTLTDLVARIQATRKTPSE
jgi:hypothetical protein